MTLRPDRESFRSLARSHTVVPVWRELVADMQTPVAAFARLAGEGPGFLLESVEHGERWARFSFAGRGHFARMVARGRRVEVEGRLPDSVPRDEGILAAVEELLRLYRSPVIDELPPLHSGLVGYLGYDVVREVERLPSVPPDDVGAPDAVLSVIGPMAAFDHWRQRVFLIDNVVVDPAWGPAEVDAAYDAAAAAIDSMAADLGRPLADAPAEPPDPAEGLPGFHRRVSPEEYQAAV
ncbi:MAG TPA: anthranilate synthase component I, partial [Acidimicrobiales bacterium]|nr:anthranilate synthase component I [Acidimicrobiales bacterium]